MAHQIIKQSNGLFCIYSTIVDSIIEYNLTFKDIVKSRIKKEKKRIEQDVSDIIEKLNDGQKPYYQFTYTFNEVMSNTKRYTKKNCIDMKEYDKLVEETK